MKARLLKILPAFLLLAGSPLQASAGTIKSASYWIKRLAAPDALVLTPDEINGFNRYVLGKTDEMADMEKLPPAISGQQLTSWLTYDPLPENERFGPDGKRAKIEFFSELRENMNFAGIRESNGIRFGVAVKRADIRAFPTDRPLLKRPGAREFDTVQYSSIYPPERVALLHTSKDGLWGFFQTGLVRGWIRLDNIAFEDKEKAVFSGKPLVITGSHVKVYGDKGLKRALASVPMGDALPIEKEKDDTSPWMVKFPQKNGDTISWVDGYIDSRADVRVGYLSYTRRNVITQAFKMLGEKYGWGGKDGRRDCSEFVKDIFASMGIRLPRNSHEQSSVGVNIASIESSKGNISKALKNAEPGITLIGLERHIMLYIGSKGGRPYVIHQFVGYRSGKRFKTVNRVDVTTLNLGARSREGSFKARIKSVTEVLAPQGGKTPDHSNPASTL